MLREDPYEGPPAPQRGEEDSVALCRPVGWGIKTHWAPGRRGAAWDSQEKYVLNKGKYAEICGTKRKKIGNKSGKKI